MADDGLEILALKIGDAQIRQGRQVIRFGFKRELEVLFRRVEVFAAQVLQSQIIQC